MRAIITKHRPLIGGLGWAGNTVQEKVKELMCHPLMKIFRDFVDEVFPAKCGDASFPHPGRGLRSPPSHLPLPRASAAANILIEPVPQFQKPAFLEEGRDDQRLL